MEDKGVRASSDQGDFSALFFFSKPPVHFCNRQNGGKNMTKTVSDLLLTFKGKIDGHFFSLVRSTVLLKL